MNINKKKLPQVVILSVCIVGLCVVVGVLIVLSKNNVSLNEKKYVSWASKVTINPEKPYQVTDVIDGDTIKANIDRHSVTVRLLGINTPEVVDPRKPVECYGKEASAETKSLLTGKMVLIALNPNYERIDKYGRLLAYVRRVDDVNESSSTNLFINEYLIKEGYAYEYTFNEKNPYQYQSEFRADELEAKQVKKGLWGKCQNNQSSNN